MLTEEHIRYLAEMFRNVCGDFGATLVECNREDDYLHLLAAYPPKVPVPALVNSLKGVSAHKIRQRYPIRTHREHLSSPPTSPPPVVARHCRSSSNTSDSSGRQAANPGLNAGVGAARVPVMTRRMPPSGTAVQGQRLIGARPTSIPGLAAACGPPCR